MAKNKYLATAPEYDGDEWYEFEGWDYDGAAEAYAESADANSGGEFEDATVVLVKEADAKEADGVVKKFIISVDHEKTFYAYERPMVAA